MDDFGSGYSSLNMLKEAPVDEIKLDMRFLSAADPYGRAEEILHMIITMGNHMKLSIIAEGVETEQQKVMLQGFGCNKAQGYFYARPMREAEYTELLRKEKEEKAFCRIHCQSMEILNFILIRFLVQKRKISMTAK